jgi:chemotaxis response regulator CheB
VVSARRSVEIDRAGTEHPIVAIILSGFDGDGSDGLQSIRERGGLAIAQDLIGATDASLGDIKSDDSGRKLPGVTLSIIAATSASMPSAESSDLSNQHRC